MRTHPILATVAAVTLLTGSAAAQVTFVDVISTSGISNLSWGRGSAAADMDGDGLIDFISANTGSDNKYWHQLPDHTFEDANVLWGVDPDLGNTWGALVTDFDGDYDPDVFFSAGAFVQPEANKMLRNELNDASGILRDSAAFAGDVNLAKTTFGASALDYDLDGDVDIYLCNRLDISTLLRNNGNLNFTDVAVSAGLIHTDDYRHSGAADFDNDGWPDIGVGAAFGPNRLYHNNQDGTFTDVAVTAGVSSPDRNFGVVFEDFDNDGLLDIFLPKMKTFAQPDWISELYMNQGDGTFVEATQSNFSNDFAMGHNTTDLTGDGYPDVFIGTGIPQGLYDDVLQEIVPDGNGSIIGTDISVASGILASGPTRCHGIVFTDYDLDGDVDVYVNNGGIDHVPGGEQADFLWNNQGGQGNWFKVALTGIESHTGAVGAKVWIVTSSDRVIRRNLQVGKGFTNTDSPTLFFSLGSDTYVKEVHVDWPLGIHQNLVTQPKNTQIDILEAGMHLVGTPAIGSTISMDAVGPPNGFAEYMFSVFETDLPLPKFGGTLKLLPILIGPLPVPLDASGETQVPLDIPNDPALVGGTLYVQSWIHEAGATQGGTLSNLLSITFE